ncbi:MAG: hypothetical protein LBD20_00960 [Spirochaetaceae bacterium]|jgi:hypothetical protein|nr:hypothetical protein [Spirochaetaceae bacterium]
MRNVFWHLAAACLIFAGCDMTHISKDDQSARRAAQEAEEAGMSEEEMLALEKDGHFLKLVNMPANTQSRNTQSAGVHNSAQEIGKMDAKNAVKIYRADGKTSVYINLVYTQGGAFEEDGPFYVSVAVYIDALTWIDLKKDAGVLVQFTEGRGTLDVLTLPEGAISPNWPVSPDGGADGDDAGDGWWGEGDGRSPDEILDDIADQVAEMEANGHYIQLYHLPAGVLPETITGTGVTDGTKSVAVPDAKTPVLLAPDGVYINAYIPLVKPAGGEFTRAGQFIVFFTVQIDALTKITVTRAHNVIVNFVEGRGTLDVEHLLRDNPDIAEVVPDTDNEDAIADIIQRPHIRFYNIPRSVSVNSFSSIAISNAERIVGRADYETVAIRKDVLTAEAFIAITDNKAGYFGESGAFYVSFSIIIDALTKIIVQPSYAALYTFADGVAEVDVSLAPPAPARPPVIPHCLTIGGLPNVTGNTNIFNVLIYNSAGIVAKCPDYTKIYTIPYNGGQIAVIPLVYDNNKAFTGKEYDDNGNFIVTFSIYPDASTVISVTVENNFITSFANGNAYVDISNIPPVPRNCLVITNLPSNTQMTDISSVFIHSQAGKIAQCQGYDLVTSTVSGNTAALRIPLVYMDADLGNFAETGSYYVAFDLNVDALTRVVVREIEHIAVSFVNGNGTLDARNLPQALPIPYLTIMGLPFNTAKGNFSEVFVYNAAGKLAKCNDYLSILITRNAATATAFIPLVYNNNSSEFFRDSGEFVITFTINIDINTVIIKQRTDNLAVQFTDGSANYNIADGLGYISGGLLSYTDLGAPIIKAGTIFEMNGGYEKITANAPVQNQSFNTTRVIYVYAAKSVGNLSFIYSDTAPVWNAAKRGYYNGNNRALYKLLYIKDTVVKYAAKTYISDSFKNFDHYVVDNPALSGATNLVYSLNGAANPAPASYSAAAGWYLLQLRGAGGGGSGGLNGHGGSDPSGAAGGAGGAIAEFVYFSSTTALSTFTGSGGGGAGYNGGAHYQGAGGGGGGSGTFVYSLAGYFLCAGGGGGAGGGSAGDGGGAGGGAGGSIGSGGGGGGGGYGDENSNGYPDDRGTPGGAGGGISGGAGGSDSYDFTPGANAGYALSTSTGMEYRGAHCPGDEWGGWGGHGGQAAFAQYNAPNDWKNTNNANGQGAGGTFGDPSQGTKGGDGGNNRNAVRGGGGPGGAGGIPADDTRGCGTHGTPGSLSIHKIF